jgi:predicted ester cyclase
MGSDGRRASAALIRLFRMSVDSAAEAANKALIKRWFEEVWNQGRQEVIEQLRAPNAMGTGLGEGNTKAQGAAEFTVFFLNLRGTFPDLHVSIEDILAEGDKVAVRFSVEGTHGGAALGVTPTGRKVRFSGMTIARIAAGKIVEGWNNLDQLGLLTQIGALPANPGADRFLTAHS